MSTHFAPMAHERDVPLRKGKKSAPLSGADAIRQNGRNVTLLADRPVPERFVTVGCRNDDEA